MIGLLMATASRQTTANAMDVIRYEMNLAKRRHIEDFVLGFFKDWKTRKETFTVTICLEIFADTQFRAIANLASRYVNRENFELGFHKLCHELFSRGKPDSYVVSLLAFSAYLDEILSEKEWYESRFLYEIVIMELAMIDFNPEAYYRLNTQFGMVRSVLQSFVLLVPALLLIYLIHR